MKRLPIALFCLLAGLGLGAYLVGSFTHGQQANPAAQAVPGELVSYRDIVKKVLPAVVSIETKAKPLQTNGKRPGTPLPDNPQVPEEFRKFFEQHRFDEGQELPRFGFGSGFFMDPTGVILTNFHVVDGADQVSVHLQDGRVLNSRSIKLDRRTDLAVIVLDDKGPFPSLEFGDSDAMQIGDHVLAVGAPFGLTGTVTHGIVSAKGRDRMNMNMYEDFLQTDAAINPGNSGGPLVNLDGKVVGINAAIKSRSGGFQGVGLAIASNLAGKVSKALRTDGVVHRGYLGVQIRELDPEVASRLGIAKGTGVVVAEVFDNTSIVADLPLNKAVEIKIMRDNQALDMPVIIEEQPMQFGSARVPAQRDARPKSGVAIDKIGVEVNDLTDEIAEASGFRKGTQGAIITRVEPGSIAESAGLRKGMLIAKVENQKVTAAAAVRQALESADLSKGVVLQVQSPQGGTNFVMLKSQG
ncbi:MAG: trypsin-like peptidase domain-containing protein [Planctomycetes bacterium]|nr:trypsin-like peptidase domain-containing protein [Planctomycetota bacterium]